MFAYNSMVVLAATLLLGAGCGLAGVFAVLRRRALIGDVAAHAALPGLCLAFLLTGRPILPTLLAGAVVSALLAVGAVSLLAKFSRLREDAVLGVVLGAFYGAGVSLDSYIQTHVASASQAGLDSFFLGKTAGVLAADVYWIAGAALVCTIATLLLFKEWTLLAFDPEYGAVQGWPIAWLEFLLLGSIVLMVVIGLPMVGVVMTAALLILPATAARFWTDRLDRLAAISASIGAMSACIGATASAAFDRVPAGPAIVLTGGAFFLLSLLFAPLRGLAARARKMRWLEESVRENLVLRWLYRSADPKHPHQALDEERMAEFTAWPDSQRNAILKELEQEGVVRRGKAGEVHLTSAGWNRALPAVQTEALWLALIEESPDGAVFSEVGDRFAEVTDPSDRLRLEQLLRSEGRWPTGPDHAEGD